MNTQRNGVINRLLALIYVFSIYASLIVSLILTQETDTASSGSVWNILIFPAIIWICCLAFNVINHQNIDRQAMFDAVIIMKYLMIPLFGIGGLMVVAMALLTFIPVVFMIVVGPMTAMMLSIIGWCYMASGMVFSIPYFIKARKENINGLGITIASIICQFFFGFDVISMMILTVKENRWKKTTIAMICIICAAVLAGIAGIIVAVTSQ